MLIMRVALSHHGLLPASEAGARPSIRLMELRRCVQAAGGQAGSLDAGADRASEHGAHSSRPLFFQRKKLTAALFIPPHSQLLINQQEQEVGMRAELLGLQRLQSPTRNQLQQQLESFLKDRVTQRQQEQHKQNLLPQHD